MKSFTLLAAGAFLFCNAVGVASQDSVDGAFSDCTALVLSNGHASGASSAAKKLDQHSRIAACVGKRGFRPQAIAYLKDALHRVQDEEVIENATSPQTDEQFEEDALVEESANARLAVLEFQSGQIAAARARVHGYYGNTPEMKAAWLMIDPPGHVRFMQRSDARSRAYDRQFSADQLAVLKKEGMNYRQESFDASGYHEVTWWYGGDEPRVAYTFVNGKLTSIYRP